MINNERRAMVRAVGLKRFGFAGVCGYTLIEILLVLAIIGILSAIAIPNSLKAQRRAKVAAALVDMKTIATGLEAFNVENGSYPSPETHAAFGALAGVHETPLHLSVFPCLTSPIAYISRVPFDPFDNAGKPLPDFTFNLNNDTNYCVGRYDYNAQNQGYLLASNGPDGKADPGIVLGIVSPSRLEPGDEIAVSQVVEDIYWNDTSSPFRGKPQYFVHPPGLNYVYDPTNGSASSGGLFFPGP